ncbi:MAG: putative dTDP-4-dehydrorhamnose reductase [Candidatus Gottesmanbacteria bacterium GW2011_GWC2_42_8]|nr:MAG: putative dTDP-4-dehydrorhamnose reductase [Candidatus Gottesmanbacteria bacterium GW2011_GWC2_42_8]
MKIPILATGLSGMVGTRVAEILSDNFEFEDISLATGIDITDKKSVDRVISESESKIVLHLAAKTDVDSCEDDKVLGEEGAAWQINVVGTENIIEAAKANGKRVIYISTDFVFNGTKDGYQEDDKPNPVSWYGYTKYQGEERLSTSDVSFTVLRISYPYRNLFEQKKDFVHRIIDQLKIDGKIMAVRDHIITPTFIDDIAFGLSVFLKRNISGIYHLVGSSSLSAEAATRLIRTVFNLSGEINPIDRSVYFKDRAFRPFNLTLRNDKIGKLGIRMSNFKEGLKTVKTQDSL